MAFIQIVQFFDPPQVLDAAVTTIPAASSLPLQVVATTPRLINRIDYIDGTGDYMGLYVGPAGSEVLNCIIGGGQTSSAWGVIPVNSRVSIRSMSASTIASGTIFVSFIGYQ